MAQNPEPIAPSRSVQRALRVLETVARHGDGVRAERIAQETGLPEEQLARILPMLSREGYIARTADDGYVVGETLLLLGSGANHRRALKDKLQKTLRELRDTVGAAVYISHYVDGEFRITQYADGPSAPKVNEWVDFRYAAHASAAGKCLLSQLDHDARRDHLARHRTARFTSRTITDEKVLLSKLENQPPTVPVLDLQEYAVGTVCAAVPITAGKSVGSIALSLPVRHAHRLRQAADTLNRRATPLLLSLAI
ncbi:IclR family transcriptional regulator [Streptomyces sp. TP-A0874]|uniref:IclR family transcriptional regulator n=1 Tax=Streptomyces sp. TP-A0874 TaxID=549819 RepID=UPI000853B978|nr:IclR family transcriptional regulator C-terminal domain-containing protein [Streptomyces sp. TP-A0874]